MKKCGSRKLAGGGFKIALDLDESFIIIVKGFIERDWEKIIS